MSEIYRRRLIRIQDERDAAQDALAYIQENWHKNSIFNEKRFVEGSSLHDVTHLAENLDAIFLIRLFAAFEGMLRQHMTQYHPGSVTDDAGAALLIDQVAVSQPKRITINLCDRVHEVRKYRNSLAHPQGKTATEVTFTETLARLAQYLGWLPEPR